MKLLLQTLVFVKQNNCCFLYSVYGEQTRDCRVVLIEYITEFSHLFSFQMNFSDAL